MGQSLIYNHMSHHYRRIYNAKSCVDCSPPRVPRPGQRVMASPCVRTCSDIPPSSMALVDELIYDTKLGPAAYCSQIKDWACCNCRSVSPGRQHLKATPVMNKRPVNTVAQPAIMADRHARCFDPPFSPFQPPVSKVNAQSKVRDLKVYHPPRKKVQKRPKVVQHSHSPGQSVRTQAPGQSVRTQAPGQSVRTQAPGQSVRTQAPGQSVRTQAPGQSVRTLAPAKSQAQALADDSLVRESIPSKEEWKPEDQVDDGISSASSAGPWLQMPLYMEYPPTSSDQKPSSEESSRDSAYNGGVSSGGESRGPTPEHSPEKPAAPPVHLTPVMEARLKKQKEEALYIQFIHEITQDVLNSGIFSNKGLRQVFQRHINLNKNKLDMERMKAEVARLQIQLDMPDDEEDTFPLPSKEDIVLGWPSSARGTDEQGLPPPSDVGCDSAVRDKLRCYCSEKSIKMKVVDGLIMSPSEVIQSLLEMGFSRNMAEEICQSLSDKDLPQTPEVCRDMSAVLSSEEDIISRGSPRYSEISADRISKERIEEKKISKESIGEKRISKESIGEKIISKESVGEKRISKESIGEKRISEESIGETRVPEESFGETKISEESVGEIRISRESVEEIRDRPCLCGKDMKKAGEFSEKRESSVASATRLLKEVLEQVSGSLLSSQKESKQFDERVVSPRYSKSSAEKILREIIESFIESAHSSHRGSEQTEMRERRHAHMVSKSSAEIILREIHEKLKGGIQRESEQIEVSERRHSSGFSITSVARFLEEILAQLSDSPPPSSVGERKGSLRDSPRYSRRSVENAELLGANSQSSSRESKVCEVRETSYKVISEKRSPPSRIGSGSSKKLDLIQETAEHPDDLPKCTCSPSRRCCKPRISKPKESDAADSEILVAVEVESSTTFRTNSSGSASRSAGTENSEPVQGTSSPVNKAEGSDTSTGSDSEKSESLKVSKARHSSVSDKEHLEDEDRSSLIEEDISTADDVSDELHSVKEELCEGCSSSDSSISVLASQLKGLTVDKDAFRPSFFPADETDLVSREELSKERQS
ncbi:serine-rich adhesin for platelets isoform X2 [Anabrus simplex]